MKGIENINFFFYNRYPNAKLEVYFLSIEIFIRLMAISPLKISLQTLESHIQKSFLSAMKYYREIIQNPLQHRDMPVQIYQFF